MPELGKKYTCYSCHTKFYDLGKPEPICPKCGADQRDAEEAPAPTSHRGRSARPAPPPPPPPPVVEEPIEDEFAPEGEAATPESEEEEDIIPEPEREEEAEEEEEEEEY